MQFMQQKMNNLFSWWYVDTFDYREVLNRKETHLIAMERDGQLLNEDVRLRSENQTAIAILGNGREFLLLPNQWVTPRTDNQINSFWLAKELDFTAPEIDDIYTIIENGSIWKSGASQQYEIFGRSGAAIAHRNVTTIIPIGNGKYIASDGQRCSVISKREHDETAIRINMQQIIAAN